MLQDVRISFSDIYLPSLISKFLITQNMFC